MRKVLFTTLLLLAATLTAGADTYNYMVFEASDGTQLSMTADGLKLVYNDGTLTAISGDVSRTFAVSDLNRMFFSDTMQGTDATAIQEIKVATPGQAATTPGQGATTPGQGATNPGQSATTPDQGATTPGQSATTPGQSATTPDDSSSGSLGSLASLASQGYEVYDLSGRRVATSGTQLKPGLYIFKKGNTTTKRYIK